MKIIIANIDRLSIHIVYHRILQVHSISSITETYSCLVILSTSLHAVKWDWLLKILILHVCILCIELLK